MRWKIGELARAAGVTVRTLHHYDAQGLLRPERGASSDHRLYSPRDLRRLLVIRSLRQMGFGLAEIRRLLEQPGASPEKILDAHLDKLEQEIRLRERVRRRLETVRARLAAAEEATVAEFLDALQEMEAMERFDKYYTPEQLEQLAARRGELGEEGLRQAEQDWRTLYDDVRRAIAEGVDPASERGRELARRWDALIEAFTGGDPGIAASLARMYQQEPQIWEERGFAIDPELCAFVDQARRARDE